jgi:hypothetical protein
MLYVRVLEKQFPKLLLRPDIPPQEKEILRSLIYDKPHYPYLRRHEHASELVHRVPQFSFNQLMGHSRTSQMYDVYVQDFGNEGLRELEIADGIITREETLSLAQWSVSPSIAPSARNQTSTMQNSASEAASSLSSIEGTAYW